MKKSLYVYLSSLLGILLFMTLHRVLVFFYLLLASYGYEPLAAQVSSIQFLAIEYLTLLLAMLGGAWYGIWIGLYWYERVYEEGSLQGVMARFAGKFRASRPSPYNLQGKIEAAKEKLERGMWELEELADDAPVCVAAPEPLKRRVVRKRASRVMTKMTEMSKNNKNRLS